MDKAEIPKRFQFIFINPSHGLSCRSESSSISLVVLVQSPVNRPASNEELVPSPVFRCADNENFRIENSNDSR